MDIDAAVVLAAGEGTRLRPLTAYRPKPMLPAANRPILQHVIDAVINAGIDDVHIVVGYGRDRVQNHFGSTYRERPITYHHQQSQLGTGHALLTARDVIGDHTLVLNGDEILTESTIVSVTEAHDPDTMATVAVTEQATIDQYGAVELDGTTVTDLIEDPIDDAFQYFNAGVYTVAPSFLAHLEDTATVDGELRLTDALAKAATDPEAAVRAVHTPGQFSNVTYPWDLLNLVETLFVDDRLPESERAPGVHVADTAQVHETATLQSPVVIGPDVSVHAGAIVGPQTAVGRGATVSGNAVVSQTIVDEGARVGAQAVITDGILGPDVTIDAGVTIPGGTGDVRLDTIVYENVPLGAAIADRTVVGGGTTVSPGTLIGPDAAIAPGTTIAQNVAKNAEVRR